MLLSVDIETYGYCTHTRDGSPLPTQRETKTNGRFHPEKSRILDNPSLLVATCAITQIFGSPFDPDSWTYGETLVFTLDDPIQIAMLADWLSAATLLTGHNIQFDILYLRAHHPTLAAALDRDQTLIDGMILSYLHSESRPERSLKALLPLVARKHYDELPDKSSAERFTDPGDPRLHLYNAADTIASYHVARSIGRRLRRDAPAKLSPTTLSFYSRDIWACVRMATHGVTFNTQSLHRLHMTLIRKTAMLERRIQTLSTRLTGTPLYLSNNLCGSGCMATQAAFLSRFLTPEVLDHPLLHRTEKTSAVCFDVHNLLLIKHLHPDHPLLPIIRLCLSYKRDSKILSSYTTPLLYGKGPERSAMLLPTTPLTTPTPAAPAPSTPVIEEPPFVPNVTAAPVRRGTPRRRRNPWQRKHYNTAAKRARWRASFATDTDPPLPAAYPQGFAYPSWYPVPSRVTDGDDSGDGGTEQSRITCKNPALQTLPAIIKKHVTGRDGRTTRSYDLKQIELCVAGVLSGEPALLGPISRGEDLHGGRALAIYGAEHFDRTYPNVPLPDRYKRKANPGFEAVEGQVGKQVNFADLFLSSALTQQGTIFKRSQLLVPLSILQRGVDRRSVDRPVLTAWQRRMMDLAFQQGYLEACPILHQTRSMRGDVYGQLRSRVVNYRIQAVAGNVLRFIQQHMNTILPPLNDPDPPHLMTQQTYDALYFETRDPSELDGLFQSAVDWCSTVYWNPLCEHTGHHLPLKYDAH